MVHYPVSGLLNSLWRFIYIHILKIYQYTYLYKYIIHTHTHTPILLLFALTLLDPTDMSLKGIRYSRMQRGVVSGMGKSL